MAVDEELAVDGCMSVVEVAVEVCKSAVEVAVDVCILTVTVDRKILRLEGRTWARVLQFVGLKRACAMTPDDLNTTCKCNLHRDVFGS